MMYFDIKEIGKIAPSEADLQDMSTEELEYEIDKNLDINSTDPE